MGAHLRQGYTIIEVMLFFAVTGALMLGVMGSASVGVNTQRYNDAVNTFTATVQQEFTNVTNVVNTKSVREQCGVGSGEQDRGISNCVIIGRLMTIDDQGNIVSSNLVGSDAAATTDPNATEIDFIASYQPKIDLQSQEEDQMSWGTKIEKTVTPTESFVSLLIMRSPRSGNVYSYVLHSSTAVIETNDQLNDKISGPNGLTSQAVPQNSLNQVMCVDRSGWVVSPARAIQLAPYTSGPSGVSTVEVTGSLCA